MNTIKPLLEKIIMLLERVEPLLPPSNTIPDFSKYAAFRWTKVHHSPIGSLQGIQNPVKINFNSICCQERQIREIKTNTLQFLHGYPANNVLLTGSKGTGKSSLVKACLNEYHEQGLKLIEIDCDDLVDLPAILSIVENEPYRFIIFCDDLSFEDNDPSYKSLKALLDGSFIAPADNVLIYATSNRRHLLPEYMHENQNYSQFGAEVHPAESIEEKISLSERFGLWISFYPFSQNEFITIVQNWLNQLAPDIPYTDSTQKEALQFSLQRGSRSGRVAQQFVKHYIGSYRLENDQ